MQPSQRLLDLIASFEGYRDKAYMCPGGKWTIGYGTTIYPGTKEPVKRGDACTKEVAWEWLTADTDDLMYQVKAAFTWEAPEHIVDACTSFSYNLGLTNFLESTFLKRLNNGDIQSAASAIKWWNKARDPKSGVKRVLGGLRARRESEADLILNGWDGAAGGTPQDVSENRPVMVKSRTVWGALIAGISTIGGSLPLVMPALMEQSGAIQTQLNSAQTTRDLIVSIAGTLFGLGMVIWSKRNDLGKGAFGSQGR